MKTGKKRKSESNLKRNWNVILKERNTGTEYYGKRKEKKKKKAYTPIMPPCFDRH